MDNRNFDDTFKQNLEKLSQHSFSPQGWENVQQQLERANPPVKTTNKAETNWKTIALVASLALLCTQFVILSMFWFQKEELKAVREELVQIKSYQYQLISAEQNNISGLDTNKKELTLSPSAAEKPSKLKNVRPAFVSPHSKSQASLSPTDLAPGYHTFLSYGSQKKKDNATGTLFSTKDRGDQAFSSIPYTKLLSSAEKGSQGSKKDVSPKAAKTKKSGFFSDMIRPSFERVSYRLNAHLSQHFYRSSYGRVSSSPSPMISMLFSSPDHPYTLSMGIRGRQSSFFSDDISKAELTYSQITSFPGLLEYGAAEDLHEIHTRFTAIDLPIFLGINSRLNYKSFLRTEIGTSLTRYVNNSYEYDFFTSGGDGHAMFVHEVDDYWDWGQLEIRAHVVNRFKKNIWFEYGLGGQFSPRPQGPEGRNFQSIHLSLGMGFGK